MKHERLLPQATIREKYSENVPGEKDHFHERQWKRTTSRGRTCFAGMDTKRTFHSGENMSLGEQYAELLAFYDRPLTSGKE